MNYIKDHNGCWTVVCAGEVHTFDKNHTNYEGLIEAIKVGDEQVFSSLISVGKAVQEWSKLGFTFTGGILYYGREEVATQITAIILDMIDGGFSETPILNFMKRLFDNPSHRAVKELYSWLAHKSLAICEDGTFLAYKSVLVYDGPNFVDCYGREVKTGDYVDKYTGRIRNNIGDINEMPRRQVDDNFEVGCSYGFHVGSLKYVTEVYSSNKQIICKVDPADVVSVPLDCDCQKIRCCSYEVVSEFKNLKIVERKVEDYVCDEDEDRDEDDICEDCGFECDNGVCDCYDDDDDDDDENIDIYFGQ
jgi:hypothetical protein